jgi:RNA 3'-phosphate cyclase
VKPLADALPRRRHRLKTNDAIGRAVQPQSLLVLDGNHGEGGGQILRTALFLSLLTRRPFRIDRIRENRRTPGLKPQHEGIIRLLAEMTHSTAKGVRVGAQQIEFEPGRFRAGAYAYDIGTAGSIPLFLQTILPVMLATPGRTELDIVGGTDVTFGPTIEWLRRTYAPLIQPLATELSIHVERRGFYPKGGGRVRVVVRNALAGDEPERFQRHVRESLWTDRTAWTLPARLELVSVAHTALGARRVAERQASACEAKLASEGFVADLEPVYADAFSMGSSLTLVAQDRNGNRIGADGLGAQGVTAEAVGQRVAATWVEEVRSGAAVDEHLADHLVPWIALGAGPVRVPRPTGHLETNVWVCQQFLGVDAVRLDGLVVRPAHKK